MDEKWVIRNGYLCKLFDLCLGFFVCKVSVRAYCNILFGCVVKISWIIWAYCFWVLAIVLNLYVCLQIQSRHSVTIALEVHLFREDQNISIYKTAFAEMLKESEMKVNRTISQFMFK